MKGFLKGLIFIPIFLFCSSCQDGGIDGDNNPDNIKYFGYYGAATFWDTSALNEISDHCNIAWVGYFNVEAKLNKAREKGMKVVLHLQDAIFSSNLTLHNDWEDRLEETLQIAQNYRDIVLAYYPVDEPYLQGVKHDNMSSDEVYDILKNVTSFLRDYDRNLGQHTQIWVIFAYNYVKTHRYGVNETLFDAVGFDLYGTWKGIESMTRYLDSKLVGNQKIIVVPQAFVQYENGKLKESEDVVADRFAQYFSLASNVEKVVGIIPFIWDNVEYSGPGDQDYMKGAKYLPSNLLRKIKVLGKTVSKK